MEGMIKVITIDVLETICQIIILTVLLCCGIKYLVTDDGKKKKD